jgi:hypothetical protein
VKSKKWYIVFVLIVIYFGVYSQKYNDFAVSLHEESINKVFVAIGDIKGESDYEVMLIKGSIIGKSSIQNKFKTR